MIKLLVFASNRFNHWIFEPFVVEVVLVALKNCAKLKIEKVHVFSKIEKELLTYELKAAQVDLDKAFKLEEDGKEQSTYFSKMLIIENQIHINFIFIF